MTTDEILEKLGGRDGVMAITGAHRNAVNNWRNDGIPYKHWRALSIAAAERGVADVNMDALQAARDVVETRKAAEKAARLLAQAAA